MKKNNFTSDQKIKAASKYSNKYTWKLKQDFELARQSEEFLKEKGILIPANIQEFLLDPEFYLVNTETGEYNFQYFELIKMIYELRKCNKGIYAMFDNPTGIDKQRVTLLGAFHSKHRYSNVWNWKKSKLLRSKIKNYLEITRIHETKTPMHLVLTVPHKDGKFKGSSFYASEILKKFNQMRKDCQWNRYIHGGEYGVEIKKGKEGNGLHIHLHCLVFLNKKYEINTVREYILHEWNLLTDSEFIHFETLYTYKKDSNGQYITENIKKKEIIKGSGCYEHFIIENRRKKFYIDDQQKWFKDLSPGEKLENYTAGVMECIKYHFKHDCCTQLDGNYDIELINEILRKSKGLRFHAKFGALYGEKLLSISDNSIVSSNENDIDNELHGNIDNSINNIINPYTGEKANSNEFKVVISFPAKIDHLPASDINSYMPVVRNKKIFYEVKKDLSLKDIILYIAKNKYGLLFEADIYDQFCLESIKPENLKKYERTRFKAR